MVNRGSGGHNHPITDKICSFCNKTYQGPKRSKFCSTLCLQRNDYSRHMMRPRYRLSKLLSMAKNRAKSKQLPFDLDIEYLTNLWCEHNAACQISKIPFDLTRPEKGVVHPYAPSIDRITPELGYVKGNVRLMVYQMNVALSEFGLEQFNLFIREFISNTNFR